MGGGRGGARPAVRDTACGDGGCRPPAGRTVAGAGACGAHRLVTSRRKSFPSVTFSRPSGYWAKRVLTEPAVAGLKGTEGTMALGGGVPVKAGNEFIGAIGVSGAPGGDKDEACAN